MNIRTTTLLRWRPWLVVLAISLVAAHGLFRDALLSGHDAMAQVVAQEQFHRTLAEGVLVPRWDGEGRFGQGHAKLQYRPPLLHYLAEFWRLATGRPLLSLNLALATLVVGAGLGMYGACRQLVRAPAAMVGAAAYVTMNYLLADLYLRGAYSEVAALACLPWVLWGQTCCLQGRAGRMGVLATGLAWMALMLGHPQIFVLFLPLALVHFCWCWNEFRSQRGALAAALAMAGGILLAAPYWLVALRELPWVRMDLFGLGLEAYPQHFIGWRELLLERWPETYQRFAWQDWLGRPRHWEMRRLDGWVPLVLLAVWGLWPWLGQDSGKVAEGRLRRLAVLCLGVGIGAVLLALPLSRGIWWTMPTLHTFNFPWRSLGIAGLALAFLAGLAFEGWRRRLRLRDQGWLAALVIVGLLAVAAWPHSGGWPDTEFSVDGLRSEVLRRQDDIPQQFYTPTWVRDYAVAPADQDAWVADGDGEVKLVRRGMTRWDLAVVARSPIRLVVAHHAWPGWRLAGVGPTPLTPEIYGPQGWMAFAIPPGTWTARLHLGTTPAQLQGWWIAGLGLVWLGLGTLLIGLRKQSLAKDADRKHITDS